MPTYDYQCEKCGNFEMFQKMNEKPLANCPKCQGKVKRLIGAGAGLIFKGSGFYITDYKKKGSSGDSGESGSSVHSHPKSGKASKGAVKKEGSSAASQGKTEST